MLRCALAGVVCVVLFLGKAFAEEVKGEYVKWDADKKELVIKVDGKEKVFSLNDRTVLYTLQGKPNKFGLKGLNRFKPGRVFQIKTEVKDGTEEVTEIRPMR